ncbi:protein YraQ [Enterobacter cancerogenus]|uniref:Protein YraQ n=1 Tax=Enterobacter cancerogenus TaxID=69218 RepID=A0A484WDL4_9ENTR|nr:protein YraQ [Enterobacter cancerogenus]
MPVCDPNAAEIPIVQTMMLAGMGTAPALALLITLPAVSLPSFVMLRKSFPAKALWLTAGLVALSGIICGKYCAAVKKKPGGASAYRAWGQV